MGQPLVDLYLLHISSDGTVQLSARVGRSTVAVLKLLQLTSIFRDCFVRLGSRQL